ncbi:MAG: 2OG-Fe(II) oxygenase [Pseudomonadota bacterium]
MDRSPAYLPCFASSKPLFTAEECRRIQAIGERRPAIAGVVQRAAPSVQPHYEEGPERDSAVAFLDRGQETEWIYQRLFAIARDANSQNWRFELSGSERLQFARYGSDQHYNWHMDLASRGPNSFRKLSITVQLSDPADYEGGNLEFKLDEGTTTTSRDRGVVTLFPSYVLHRVTPVTAGVRCSLVHWLRGDKPFA